MNSYVEVLRLPPVLQLVTGDWRFCHLLWRSEHLSVDDTHIFKDTDANSEKCQADSSRMRQEEQAITIKLEELTDFITTLLAS